MKKLSLLLFSVFAVLSASAQTVNIHFKNGTTINLHEDLIESIDFSAVPAPPTITAGEAVDLGLSVMWASCNLGAQSPSESGGYYSWGETSEKTEYSKENYAYYNASTTEYTSIGEHIAGTDYDAAHVNLGGGWMMPTNNQINELIDKCTWEWMQIEDINGYRITGPNGNSIFLPAAGQKSNEYLLNENKVLRYWGDGDYKSEYGDCIISDAREIINHICQKYYGISIRPVISYDDYNGTTDYDDSVVTTNISAYYAGGSIMSNGGTVLSGSKLNFYFKNGSSESVQLTGICLVDGNGNVGSNLLGENVTVSAGESAGYTITLNSNMNSPKCRFTYMYNHHTYYVEAEYQSMSFSAGRMTELITEFK